MKAFVTGGHGAIGRAIVNHLEAKGWAVCDLHKHDLDVTSYMACAPLKTIPYDLIVCAHGVLGEIGKVESYSTDWREAIEVNLIGTYNVCSCAIAGVLKRRATEPEFVGNIITLGGGGGMLDPICNISAYAASKAGIVSLTKTLSDEHRGAVRLNCIFPGPQDSVMWDQFLSDKEKSGWIYDMATRMRATQGWVPIQNTLNIIDNLIASDVTGQTLFARAQSPEAMRVERPQ